MKKLLIIHLLSLLLLVSCNKTDNDTPAPVEPEPEKISCSLESIKHSYGAESLGDIEYRYTLDALGDILTISMHTLDVNAMMNQSSIEYNDKKQPIKVTYQDSYYLARNNQEPLYLVPRSYSSISLFTYDNQGRVVSSKFTSKDPHSTQVLNTTFEYATDKVVATLRSEAESQDAYTLITYEYKDGNLIKKTLQKVNTSSPYSTVDEYEYAQELNKNTQLNRISALLSGTPIASKNLVKYSKGVYSSQVNPVIHTMTYQFNEHGYVTGSNGNITFTYGCK